MLNKIVPVDPANLVEHHVNVGGDNPFQQQARLLQSLYRHDQGLPPGQARGKELGSLLTAGDADAGRNFLTPAIRTLVESELALNAHRREADSKLLQLPRLRNNLLSSQPLCFNLFGELMFDRKLATRLLSSLWPARVQRVLDVRFEWSPGRLDARYLGNRSAADVFIETVTPEGHRSFIAFETKYHEDMKGTAGAWKPRYDELLAIDPVVELDKNLQSGRLQQVLYDHLLATALNRAGDGYSNGLFVLLYPAANAQVSTVISAYQQRLTPHGRKSFGVLTLETFVDSLQQASRAKWIGQFRRRYLDWERVPLTA